MSKTTESGNSTVRGIRLDTVVPWGRSFDEYVRMFNLGASELERSILGCGDGPASFNSEAYARGVRIISVDPLYHHSAQEIRRRISDVRPGLMEQLRLHADAYCWDLITSPAELERLRMQAMASFLEDYALGLEEGRYLPYSLPNLPFRHGAFDLALVSHFLFTYADQLRPSFHLNALLECLRVAQEVRVFPLVNHDGTPVKWLPALTSALAQQGFTSRIQQVDYEFQKGANTMLVVRNG
ncbi:MAG: SAM-dependent methyltransferase [Candidatus Hydrogenedentes bacterium]|nr:SAM-dependent methyltransferase [Candidatus Hydrogenedentota bacterium]